MMVWMDEKEVVALGSVSEVNEAWQMYVCVQCF